MPVHDALREAARFAQAHEGPWPRDPAAAPAPGGKPWGVHHDDPPRVFSDRCSTSRPQIIHHHASCVRVDGMSHVNAASASATTMTAAIPIRVRRRIEIGACRSVPVVVIDTGFN